MGFCFFFHIPSVNINFEKQEEEKMSWIGGSFVIKDVVLCQDLVQVKMRFSSS